MNCTETPKSRWIDRLEKGEYIPDDLAQILYFYSKQVVGHHIDMKGKPLSDVIAELDRMDLIVRQSRFKKSRWSTNEYSYNELVEILSDYHKDVHGTRLRMQGEPIEKILAALDALDAFTLNNVNLAAA